MFWIIVDDQWPPNAELLQRRIGLPRLHLSLKYLPGDLILIAHSVVNLWE
jgi:hypothetical protein